MIYINLNILNLFKKTPSNRYLFSKLSDNLEGLHQGQRRYFNDTETPLIVRNRVLQKGKIVFKVLVSRNQHQNFGGKSIKWVWGVC